MFLREVYNNGGDLFTISLASRGISASTGSAGEQEGVSLQLTEDGFSVLEMALSLAASAAVDLSELLEFKFTISLELQLLV